MKTKKQSFSNIKEMLTRDEMKKIRGGSGCTAVPCDGGGSCSSGCSCQKIDLPDGSGTSYCL
jgi:hypothetical protein